MSVDKTYFIDIFDDIMTNVQAIYDPTTAIEDGRKPYAIYGGPIEICQILTEKDNNAVWKFKKYPLVILYKAQPESRYPDLATEYLFSPLISIVTPSSGKETTRTPKRFTDNIKPILQPICELLLQEIADNPAIWQSTPEQINHTYRVWDGNPGDQRTGLLFNDYLDGIDIQFTDLRITRQVSCPAIFGT